MTQQESCLITSNSPLVSGTLLVCILALCAGASAQTPEPMENILVTGARPSGLTEQTTAGSRLGLTGLETPAAIQTLSGDDIRLRGDINVNEAVTRATGITSQATVGNGGNSVAVRGFDASSVAYLYDGVRNMGSLGNLGFPYDPWTVDRIEVLSGPASVLYGIAGIGGAVNVIPRRPSRDVEHSVRISTASFGTHRAAVDTTGPIGDRLAYRFDVSRQSSDGYIDRGESESTAVSAAFAFEPTDDLKLTVSHDYGDIHPMNYNGLPLVDGEALESLREVNYETADADVYYNEKTTRLNADWVPSDSLSVRNVTSLVVADRLWKMGPTRLNYQPVGKVVRDGYGIYEQDQEQWNNQTEVRWNNTLFGRDNVASFGADFEKLDYTRVVSTWPGESSTVDLESPIPGMYPTTDPTISPAATMLVSRYSLFAEDRLELTPKFSVVGGVRYDHSRVHRDDLPTMSRATRTFDPVNWRLGAVLEISPGFNFYAQYSKATDWISSICCVAASQLAYEPSEGKQVEIGLKQSTQNSRLEWSVAAYRIRKTNLLVPDPFELDALIQVGAQSSRGFEASVALDVGDGLRIEANGTVLDPHYDEFHQLVGGVLVSRNGNTPTNVPSESANLWVSWSFRPGWLAQGGVRYVGERFIDTANTFTLPSYTVVDANLRWELNADITIDLRTANALDEFYAPTYQSNGLGGGSWRLGAPRSYELAFTMAF